MNNMSYDVILGRDWCEANGVRIDFKSKIYQRIKEIKENIFIKT